MKIIPYFVDMMPSVEEKVIGKKLCENLKLLENFADNVI